MKHFEPQIKNLQMEAPDGDTPAFSNTTLKCPVRKQVLEQVSYDLDASRKRFIQDHVKRLVRKCEMRLFAFGEFCSVWGIDHKQAHDEIRLRMLPYSLENFVSVVDQLEKEIREGQWPR